MSITIKRARRTVDLCTDLALVAEHDRAQATLAEAQQADGQPITPSPATVKAAKAVQALEEKLRAATLHFELEAMRNNDWTAFEASHPAREDNDSDKAFDVDLSALDEVIATSIVAVTDHRGKAVEFDAKTEWKALADEISNGQWQDFALAVLHVNRGVKSAPFSVSASRVTRISADD